jgi:hypothetical protein
MTPMTRRFQFGLKAIFRATVVAALFCTVHTSLPVAHGVLESGAIVGLLLFWAPPWFWD